MSKKIPLIYIGISYSQSQSGAFGLIIGEKEGTKRLVIMIGNVEAHSIAKEIENIETPRPLTHDLFYNFAKAFDIEITEVTIYKLSEGIFYSLITCKHGDTIIEIDSRTSDAVALSLRFKCPIYTYKEILDEAGIYIEESLSNSSDTDEETEENLKEDLEFQLPFELKLQDYTYNELIDLLQIAIQNEEYEKASLIRDEQKKRKIH